MEWYLANFCIVINHQQVLYSSELPYEKVNKKVGSCSLVLIVQKRTSGISDLSWAEYFGMVADNFSSPQFNIAKDSEEDSLQVRIWCDYQGKQLSFDFELNTKGFYDVG
jgi:hypothetical protein